jgi:hypothetical protein
VGGGAKMSNNKEYLWYVFKALSKNFYGTFILDLIEFCSLWTSSVDEEDLRAFERTSLVEVFVLKRILYLQAYRDLFIFHDKF